MIILYGIISSAYALDNVPWQFSFGGKGVMSSDGTTTFTYFKPFITFGYDGKYAGFTTGYWRSIKYLITGINGNEKFIGINKVTGEFMVNAVENLSLGLEFDYYIGDYSYKVYDIPAIFPHRIQKLQRTIIMITA